MLSTFRRIFLCAKSLCEDSQRLTDFISFLHFYPPVTRKDGVAAHRTNPDSLRSCTSFRVFRFNFASTSSIFHQAEIIVVKRLIQGRNNEPWVGVEPSTLNLQHCDSTFNVQRCEQRTFNVASNHSATLPTDNVVISLFFS